MRLTELEPEFINRATPNCHYSVEGSVLTPDIQGIIFLCPACLRKLGTERGVHNILVWFKDREVPSECEPLPRWTVSGTSFEDLTLQPSIDLTMNQPEEWHGFITKGEIIG